MKLLAMDIFNARYFEISSLLQSLVRPRRKAHSATSALLTQSKPSFKLPAETELNEAVMQPMLLICLFLL